MSNAMITSPNRASVTVVRRDPAALTREDRDLIERFITRHSNYKRAKLDQVLDASAYVWLCYDGDRIVGSTAVRRLSAQVRGRTVTVIYTAVVAVDHEYRRLGLVARMGMKSYLVERLRAPLTPIYWLALAGSPSGYLQMARNLDACWPQAGVTLSDDGRAVLDQALAAMGITHVEEVEGCIVVPDDFGVLDKRQDPERWDGAPDVELFLRVNPGYRSGSDLACLCPLDLVSLVSTLVRRTLLRTPRTAQAALTAATR
jgi:hypothetical protein